jgi:hypothetical protein
MKLLIDECLSPELARLARDRGHGESSNVVWLKRGSKGQYSRVAIHAGLICLNSPEGMDLDLQLELFECALDEIGDGDLVNQVLEITLGEDDQIRALRYALPAP